ncbi:amidase family protein [Bradyrhizobium sp. sGM-13]|uniref:amidase family protein n=1 Tax=Bradyrhizobium sp. sGM-13 TaxID=2831781 RepID=UPI0028119C5D|nr:amidase family protein [Bradyrhizobium sp. sGM-13]
MPQDKRIELRIGIGGKHDKPTLLIPLKSRGHAGKRGRITGMSTIDAGAANLQGHELGVATVSGAIRRGEITAEAHATTLIQQARVNSDLASFITIDETAVLEAARAADLARAAGRNLPLLGVPIGVKDSYMTRALATSFGTSVLKDFVPTRDALVVESIRDAGALVFGKNNLVEMSYGLTGDNPHHGQTKNPYNKAQVTGGSSSGAGASVAARIVPASLGGDTVGSIRVPAALCGVVGFKPTPGRWSGDGVAPISHTLDTTGVLARNVDDCILLDGVVAGSPSQTIGAHPDLKGLRIAYAPKQYLSGVDSEVETNFREKLLRLKNAGAQIVEVDLGEDFGELTERATWTIFAKETRPAIMEFLKLQGIPVSFDDILENLGPAIRGAWEHILLPSGRGYSSDDAYNDVLNKDRPELQRRMMRLVFDRADFLIFPTTPCTAPAIETQRRFVVGGKEVSDLVLAKNTIPASCGGLPGISLPAGLSRSGLPFGIEIDSAPGRDSQLLAFARRVESVLGPVAPPPGFS